MQVTCCDVLDELIVIQMANIPCSLTDQKLEDRKVKLFYPLGNMLGLWMAQLVKTLCQ